MIKRLFPFLLLFLFLSGCKIYIARSIVYNDPGLKDNKIMPVRTVKKGTPLNLCTSPGCSKCVLPDSLTRVLKKTGTVAFVVLKNDTIIYEWYARGYSDSSLTNPFSVTKSIVSILTGVALKEGKIKSLDEPVCNYYQPYRKEGVNKITFKNLLCMSSGVNYHDKYLSPFGQTAQIYYGNNESKLINSFSIEKEPGTVFRYKNCDPEILTMALEYAVGMNMSDYASEKLWKPIGAEHDAQWIVDRKGDKGIEKSYCCFHTDARDLARIGMLYEHSGNWHGQQIVDSSYVKASLTPHHLINEESGLATNNNGYLWWMRGGDATKDFSADGLKGQYISVLPEKHLIFVRLGKRDWLKRNERFKKHKSQSLYNIIRTDVLAAFGS